MTNSLVKLTKLGPITTLVNMIMMAMSKGTVSSYDHYMQQTTDQPSNGVNGKE